MPAYRSSAEAEIRDAVVGSIRLYRPDARIIHEINTRDDNTNRIDVLAVCKSEIIAVEIKSERDKLDRLDAQMKAMSRCAHHAIAAIHEKFLVERVTNEYAAHYERDGVFYLKELPKGLSFRNAWVFPEKPRALNYDSLAKWQFPASRTEYALPQHALCLLWRDELLMLCSMLNVSASARSTVNELSRSLRWQRNGKELTQGVCRLLRARECAEADAPILEVAA
ncbi:MAG: NERD domain-containing protein [Agrobacterium cavarae]|uniref:NERD domain-containing protein n=1 Tax=Agrobacterium cavarae TaxID=2528239 RepID=UPI0031B3C5A1